jgi:hypothetical protein
MLTPSGGTTATATDFTVQMRFYFWHAGKRSSGQGSNEFKGWRYPFGSEMQ